MESTLSNLILLFTPNAHEQKLGFRYLGGDFDCFKIDVNGKLEWGPGGTEDEDVALYRNSANQLKTDDQIVCDDGIVTKVKDGPLTDGDFSVDTNGLLAIDSANGRIYFRYNGSWHYVNQTGGFEIPQNEVGKFKVGDIVIGKIDKLMNDGAAHAKYISLKEALEELGVKFNN